ncbi:MAG TPA: O-antigen ligase family protein [Bacteroidales bacterium]
MMFPMKYIIKALAIIVAITVLANISFISVFKINLGSDYYAVMIVAFVYLIITGKTLYLNSTMVIFVFACLISILFNEIPDLFNPYQRFIAFLIVMGLVGPLITNHTLQKFRLNVFEIINILIVAMVLISFIGGAAGLPIMYRKNALAGVFNHSMVMGPMAAIAMIVSINWLNKSEKRNRRWGFVVAALAFLTCVAAGSRVALMAAIAGTLFYYYKINQGRLTRFVRSVLLIGFLLVVSFPLWETNTERLMDKMAFSNEKGDLTVSRTELWKVRLYEFKTSPIIGFGFSSVDVTKTEKFDEKEGTIEPGSSWLAVLAMTGIFGILPLIWLIFRYMKYVFRDKTDKYQSAFLGALMILFCVHMLAEGYIFAAGSGMFFYYWLLMGMMEQKMNYKLEL